MFTYIISLVYLYFRGPCRQRQRFHYRITKPTDFSRPISMQRDLWSFVSERLRFSVDMSLV